MIRFGSVCSGIEAASVAWHPLGWKAAWLAEIEPFPSAVLAHHYPDVQNLGDMTTITRRVLTGEVEAPDVFTGGTPCQAFSVAGLRRSLDDARGNLSLTFCEIADAIDHVRVARGDEPAIIVWENVPGVLSTADNAFGCFLAGLAGEDVPLVPPGGRWTNAGVVHGPARSVAWRTLDAQYFGVAQRRRRVWVVASARDGFDPAAVLFEWDRVRRDSAPRREPGKDTAGSTGDGVARCVTAGEMKRQDWETCTMVAQPVAFDTTQVTSAANYSNPKPGDPCHPLAAGAHAPAVAFAIQAGALRTNPNSGPDGVGVQGDQAYTLEARSEVQAVAAGMAVRRLTPRECSRLQGFPDDYLELTYANADEAHAAQVLHELWREAGTPTVEEQGWRAGISAALLTPEILLAGVHGGWLSWEMAARCATARGALSCEAASQEGFVRALWESGKARRSPFGRESFEQCARELGSDLSILPLEGAQARKALRDSRLWPQAQARWPLRYALAKGKARENPDRMNPDGPRYKALGNSWAVPCAAWIGRRIAEALA